LFKPAAKGSAGNGRIKHRQNIGHRAVAALVDARAKSARVDLQRLAQRRGGGNGFQLGRVGGIGSSGAALHALFACGQAKTGSQRASGPMMPPCGVKTWFSPQNNNINSLFFNKK